MAEASVPEEPSWVARAMRWPLGIVLTLLRAVPAGAEKVDEHTQHSLWWASYERGLLGSPANLLSLSTPMDEKVVADIADRLADAVLAVALQAPATEGAK